MAQSSKWYKENPNDQVWWKGTDAIGVWEFSFDRNKVYNLFQDYPYKLTGEELAIFNAENPYWVDFFQDRLKQITQ